MKKFKVFIHNDNQFLTEVEIETENLIPDACDMIQAIAENSWATEFTNDVRVQQFGNSSCIGHSTSFQISTHGSSSEKRGFKNEVFSITAISIN